MIFRQFLNEDSSCSSYLIGCQSIGECAVVDPLLGTNAYLKVANKLGLKITYVFDTHIHADHLSGARVLSEETGAPVFLHESAKVNFSFQPVKDDDRFRLGNRRLKIIHTPGHTPESISLLFDGRLVLTGDCLFVGDVGRLDLTGAGKAEELYASLLEKLLKLDDLVEVYPAHYGGSLCGKGLEQKPSSTIGYERSHNSALNTRSREEFIEFVRRNPPRAPRDYETIKKINSGQLARSELVPESS